MPQVAVFQQRVYSITPHLEANLRSGQTARPPVGERAPGAALWGRLSFEALARICFEALVTGLENV